MKKLIVPLCVAVFTGYCPELKWCGRSPRRS